MMSTFHSTIYIFFNSNHRYHGGNAPRCKPNATSVQYFTDLSNSSGAGVADGVQHAPASVNKTYDSLLFTQEAVRQIREHGDDPHRGLYLYLAFQNVHSTAQNAATISGRQPLHAPCSVVDELYGHTPGDTYKVMGGMLTMLDYGVGNVTEALEAAGRPWVMLFVSDNGGPLPHSTNSPLRGGKHTLWDGGLRVQSFVSGPLVPPHRRNTTWPGLAHSSDWWPTILDGVLALNLSSADVDASGPRAPDGHNLWPSLLSGAASPREEVIHQVANNYTAMMELKDFPAMRSGRYKIVLGDPGDARCVCVCVCVVCVCE